MTFPTVPNFAVSTLATAVQADTTAARTFPNLSSLSKNSGDLLIAICMVYDTTAASGAAFGTWGGSFTEFADLGSLSLPRIGCAYKFSTGSETGTFTVTQAATITGHAVMILMSISGAHASTPPEAGGLVTGTNTGIGSGLLDPAGWAAEDTLWITAGACGEDATTGSFTGMGTTAPTNYTDFQATSITADVVGGLDGAVAFRQLNATSEDPGVFANDASNTRAAAITIAVRPAAAVAATSLIIPRRMKVAAQLDM